jgi:hypothetical protein
MIDSPLCCKQRPLYLAWRESQDLVYLPHSRVQQACRIKFHFISTCPCTKQASQPKAVNIFGG